MTALKVITILIVLLFTWIVWDSVSWKPLGSSKKADDKDVKEMLKYIRNLDDREFEYFCTALLRELGYKAKTTKATGDGGKDIVAIDKNNEMVYVECKKYSDKAISRPQIQKLLGSMTMDSVKKGLFITTSRYSKYAAECSNMNLELWDMENIEGFLMDLNKDALNRLTMSVYNK